MAAKKFYAVRVGREPGIYESWDECKKQVSGFKGAVHASFSSRDAAEEFLQAKDDKKEEDSFTPEDSRALFEGLDGPVAYVDGSYNKKTGEYAYGVVMIENPKDLSHEIHLSGKGSDPSIASMNNVAGEIKGSMAAMRYAREHHYEKLTIFHDYKGIAFWCVPDPSTGHVWHAEKLGTKRYQEIYADTVKSVDVSFIKVKGHSGDYYNDIVDGLAKRELGVPVMKRVAEKLQPMTSRGHEFDDILMASDAQVMNDYSMV